MEWLVDGLLPMAGASLLIAKPKTGKSHLVRQLIAAVATGQPFLGRDVHKQGVLYLALEEKESEVRRHFKELMLPTDANLLVHCGIIESKEQALADLTGAVQEHPGIGLVVIDPLFKFLGVRDANAYTEVNDAVEKLLHLARSTGSHVCIIHHSKKRSGEQSIDDVLGSTALAGGVDTIFAMGVTGSGTRTLATRQRYGVDMPETMLQWDSEHRAATVGCGVDEATSQQKQRALNNVIEALIGFFAAHPRSTSASAFEATVGDTTLKKKALSELTASKELIVEGRGRRGDPFLYSLAIEDSPILAEHERVQASQDSQFCELAQNTA